MTTDQRVTTGIPLLDSLLAGGVRLQQAEDAIKDMKRVVRRWIVPASSTLPKESNQHKVLIGYVAEAPGRRVRIVAVSSIFSTTIEFDEVNLIDIPAIQRYETVTYFPSERWFLPIWSDLDPGDRLLLTRKYFNPSGKATGYRLHTDIFDPEKFRGLVIAEVVAPTQEVAEKVTIEPWFGREITLDPRFSNYNLAQNGVPLDALAYLKE